MNPLSNLDDISEKLGEILTQLKIMNKHLQELSLLPDVKELARKRREEIKRKRAEEWLL